MVLVLGSGVLAVGINAVRSDKRALSWDVDAEKYRPPPPPERDTVTREQVWAACNDFYTVIVDARAAEKYKNSRIPRAKSLPAYEKDKPETQQHMFEWIAETDQPVIVYCGGADCSDSKEIFDLLKRNHFTNVKIYMGGFQDWTEHNMPMEEGEPNGANGTPPGS